MPTSQWKHKVNGSDLPSQATDRQTAETLPSGVSTSERR